MNLDFSRRKAQGQIPRVQFSRRDFYGQLSRHYKKSALSFLLVMAGAIAISVLSPKIYQSQSLLYVRLGRENVKLDPTTTLGQASVITIPNSRETEINSVVEILKSRALSEKVVDALGPRLILDDSPTYDQAARNSSDQQAANSSSGLGLSALKELFSRLNLMTLVSEREQAIGKLAKGLSANAVSKSDLLVVSYRANSPFLAQQVVQKFVEVYLAEHAGLNRSAHAHDFLEQQTERLSHELATTEKKLLDLKQSTNMASPESQLELSVTRLYRLQEDLLNTQAQVAATTSEIEALDHKLELLSEIRVESVTTGQSNPAADGMRQLLYNLQLEEKKIAGKYTEDHPLMVAIREQIAQSQAILNLEQDARSTVTEGPNRAFEELNIVRLRQETLLAAAQSKAAALTGQIQTVQQQLEVQIENELHVARLQREMELQDTSYRKYFENLEQGHIDQALENERISNINIVQPASLTEKPVGPNVLLNLVAGLVGAFIAALGTALLFDSFDHSMKSPEDIEEKLNVPVFVSIPRLNKRMMQFEGNIRE